MTTLELYAINIFYRQIKFLYDHIHTPLHINTYRKLQKTYFGIPIM